MPALNTLDRLHGALLGLAVGDAVGTTVEFMPRGSFEPLTDMIGGGPFCLEAGQWTDDTSMALCLAASLCEKSGFFPADQLSRYWEWYRNGYMSSTGSAFDIGMTVLDALERFRRTGIYGFPMTQAAQIAVQTITEELKKPGTLEDVIFCCFSARDLAAYARLVNSPVA